jgi:hypothetical protein
MLSASITSMSRAYSTASVNTQLDRLQLLRGVETFNLHPHLPHLERVGAAAAKLDVVARQKIDLTAPPHPFTRDRKTFDAFLQSRPTRLRAVCTLAIRRSGVRPLAASTVFVSFGNVVQRPHR